MITLRPSLLPLLRAAFDAASLGDVPTALPDEYYGCRRAFAAAV